MYLLRLKKIFAILKSWTYLKTFLRLRVAPAIEHDHLWGLGFETVVDVGANKGQFSLAASKHLGRSLKIFAFEPQATESKVFQSLFRTCPNVVLYEVAIGPRTREVSMNISKSKDSSSLLEITGLQNDLYPNTEKVSTEIIKERPLVSFLGAEQISGLSLLKIDVQGYEKSVLEGSAGLLKEFDYLYCECSYVELYEGQTLAHDIIRELYEASFKVIGVYNTSYASDGASIQSDLLFQRFS